MGMIEVLSYGGCYFKNCFYDYMTLLLIGSFCYLFWSVVFCDFNMIEFRMYNV